MQQYLVRTIKQNEIKNRQIFVTVPGSKSMTNRALLMAALADGTSTLKGVLFSDDSRYFMRCVQELGFWTQIQEDKRTVIIKGDRSKIPKQEASIYVGSAGTAARFLTAWLGISKGTYRIDASEQMKKRPMAPLLESLQTLGAEICFEQKEGHFPFTIHSNGAVCQEISVNIDDSSQFLSALLICCCQTGQDFRIHVLGNHGMAYINITTKMMEEFGVRAMKQQQGENLYYFISKGQYYKAGEYNIEPDFSAACYFYAMAMLLGIEVVVSGTKKDTLQGDIQLLDVFGSAGGVLRETERGLALKGPANGVFHGVCVNMNSFSDQAITLAAMAPFADTPTTITGISHTRYQESNRIQAIITELSKLGVRCEELEDGIRIYPGPVHGGVISTYDDHRMAMGFSLIGLRVPDIIIDKPECCRKTFENYFEVFEEALKNIQGE